MVDGEKFESYPRRILRLGYLHPQKTACIFQPRGPETSEILTYHELTDQVLTKASVLAAHGLEGKRAALIFATGIDFVTSFIACLHAGVVAIPLNLSRNQHQFSRALSVLKDAEVSAILTTSDVIEYVQGAVDGTELSASHYQWMTENDRCDVAKVFKDPTEQDTAFIQYTSGSTTKPKGVVVSHGNIVENQEAIRLACRHKEGLIAGGWLPQFHDMGLIGHMLQPLYMGGTYVFMPPMSFIQRPRRWLELISYYRIESSAAPNFGYDHCVKHISEREDLSNIDLSCWTVALNGSEPINDETMRGFAKKFARLGFDSDALFPCYGMAETTLFVTGGPKGSGVTLQVLNENALSRGVAKKAHEGKVIVGCGQISPAFDVKIVDPSTHAECGKGVIGEIWLSGKSVAHGYWRQLPKSKEVFEAEVVGRAGQTYLKTGDLGYIDDGQLFVTGRIKEMIILRGQNIYPYDIEKTCNQHKDASGTSAVFSLEVNGRNGVAAIIEIKKTALMSADLSILEDDIKGAVMERHQIALDKLLLVKPGTVPKTTSGKIQRTKCREALLDMCEPMAGGV